MSAPITLTAAEWMAGARMDGQGRWCREADGRDYVVVVPPGEPWRAYVLVGPAAGSLTVDGEGEGWAVRDGAGEGGAVRSGEGDGDARRSGAGEGSAERSGKGEGWAVRSGEGAGNARRSGAGEGSAERSGAGLGYERDSLGTRLTVSAPEIRYRCMAGAGWLRVGCELHTLADWIARADEIDAEHGDGLADATRALAQRLMGEQVRP